MPEIDVRLDTGELDLRLVLQTEKSYGTILDIAFAQGVTVNGSPEAFREIFQEGLDLVNTVAPEPRNVLADIPPDPTAAPNFEIGAEVCWKAARDHDEGEGVIEAVSSFGPPVLYSVRDSGGHECWFWDYDLYRSPPTPAPIEECEADAMDSAGRHQHETEMDR